MAQWIRVGITNSGGSFGQLELDADPDFTDAIQEIWYYCEVYIPQILRDGADQEGNWIGPTFLRFENTTPTRFSLRRSNTGPTYDWYIGTTQFKTWTEVDQWVKLEAHLDVSVGTFEIKLDGTLYTGFAWTPPAGLNYMYVLPGWIDTGVIDYDDAYIGIDNMAYSLTGWVGGGATVDDIWDFETADPIGDAIANYPTPPYYASYGSFTTLDLQLTGGGPGPPGDDGVEVPFILTPSGVEEFSAPQEYVDTNTAYVDLSVSSVEVFEAIDAATVYLELTNLGGECYSTFSPALLGEGDAWVEFGSDAIEEWSTGDELEWSFGAASVEGIHC